MAREIEPKRMKIFGINHFSAEPPSQILDEKLSWKAVGLAGGAKK
jgi:hypothetical protein